MRVQSFQYRIEGRFPELKVRVWQTAWPRLRNALLWSAAWGMLAYRSLTRSGMWSAVLSLTSILLCLSGLLIANYAVQRNTLSWAQDALRLRIVRLFTRRTRIFPLSNIRDFWFCLYSHNGPVLKLDVDGSWLVLARGVREDDVGKLLVKIRQSGYSFPEVKAFSYNLDPTPKFRSLD